MKIKKTYITATLGVAASVAYSFGYLNEKAFGVIVTILGFGTAGFMRHAMPKKEKFPS